jgi:hypothetical protein
MESAGMRTRFSVRSLAVACSVVSLAGSALAQSPPSVRYDAELNAADDAFVDEGASLSLTRIWDEEPLDAEVYSVAPLLPGSFLVTESAGARASSMGSAGAGPASAEQDVKKRREAAAAKANQPYRGVFYDNDFSYINDPLYDGFYPGDQLKQLPMPGSGTVDLGGEVRVRYHHEQNMRGLGLTGLDDDFWLTRVRLFSNYRINDYFRFYGEYLYADSGGQTFTNRPIEINRGEAQNLFIDANLIRESDTSLTTRLGRQELLYGNQRLVSPLDWANTRRTFDGYKLMYSNRDWDVDGFFVHPVKRLLSNQGTNQWDGADADTLFYGTYATRKGLEIGQLDTYYLGIDYLTPGASFHTLGSRLAGSYEGLLYEFEGGTQFGRNANGSDHTAGFAVAGLGRQLDISLVGNSWKPTIWGWYDYASGEDNFADAGRFGDGFDHLFPLAHKYNGLMDLFGRRNLHDINAQLITPFFSDRVSLMLWYHYFLLDNLTTPYNVNMTPFNTVAAAADRELGHELDVLFTINLNPRNSMLVGYSYFNAGDYYTQTSGRVAGANGIPTLSDAHFVYVQYQMQF